MMIIPMIFTLDPVYDFLSQTWVFYKSISFAKRYHWPVIAQAQYFEQWDKQNRIFPQFFSKDLCGMFEYDVPRKADLSAVQQIRIPKEIEKRFIDQYKTQSDAYMATFSEDWVEMEDFLCGILENLKAQSKEKIEAVTSLTHVKFLSNVSERTGIPIIYYEWGPFRYSSYRNTAFFDVGGHYKQVYSLYNHFVSQQGFLGIPVLTKKEILALMLTESHLEYINKNNTNFEEYNHYELGIIGGYNTLTETSAYTYLNMVDLYNTAKTVFSEEEIAVRYHPGDPIHAKMNVPNEKTGELIDFILSSKRIACISSNVEVEAMLYGKRVYDIGQFKYDGIVNNNIHDLNGKVVSDEIINFIVFVCLIPFELLNSVEYYRFRLSNPTLKEIYLYHLEYYFACFGISMSACDGKNESLLETILSARNAKIDLTIESEIDDKLQNINLYIETQKYKNLSLKMKRLLVDHELLQAKMKENTKCFNEEKLSMKLELMNAKEVINKLEIENAELQQKLDQLSDLQEMNDVIKHQIVELREKYEIVMNSKSMKITKPLRIVLWKLKRVKQVLLEKSIS